jgi:hypothetical protein
VSTLQLPVGYQYGATIQEATAALDGCRVNVEPYEYVVVRWTYPTSQTPQPQMRIWTDDEEAKVQIGPPHIVSTRLGSLRTVFVVVQTTDASTIRYATKPGNATVTITALVPESVPELNPEFTPKGLFASAGGRAVKFTPLDDVLMADEPLVIHAKGADFAKIGAPDFTAPRLVGSFDISDLHVLRDGLFGFRAPSTKTTGIPYLTWEGGRVPLPPRLSMSAGPIDGRVYFNAETRALLAGFGFVQVHYASRSNELGFSGCSEDMPGALKIVNFGGITSVAFVDCLDALCEWEIVSLLSHCEVRASDGVEILWAEIA